MKNDAEIIELTEQARLKEKEITNNSSDSEIVVANDPELNFEEQVESSIDQEW